MARYEPPVGFRFAVEVQGLTPAMGEDCCFSDVGGLSVELVTEEVAEGGENRFVQKYPVRARYPELVLKRGLVPRSGLLRWVRECLLDLQVTPKDLDISLLNDANQPLLTWHVRQAWPTKWSVSDLSAATSAVVVESIQFFYQSFTLDTELSDADRR